ncbi:MULTISPECIES: phosphoribosylaminoimidazolecarboxamide formyltransferase [unclassified Nonomuraea]|uniref:phosphoribosylaminoimidazolecarboxamide formyltransferase n=1 Tax=unclassified Nonomuraea TaxID=2593643 RepID=UPI0033C79103
MDLRYGMNPQQRSAIATPVGPGRWPVRVLHSSPSYINMLDALNSWQLVSEASNALDRPAAASFKHVSPAGAAVAGPVDEVTAELNGVDRAAVGALTSAYLRARDADPKSSYGDFIAVSQPVDAELAELLTRLVCDGVIAPGYAPGTVAALSQKRGGRFLVMEADPAYVPPRQEAREVFGLRLTQERDEVVLSTALLDDVVCGTLPANAAEDLLLGLIVLRYTQSNSVCYLRGGATLGIGAGQQSRVDCTRLAGAKVDTWWLRRHPMVRALAFRSDVRLQDRINWQIRFIEGDLTAEEKLRLSGALSSPMPELTNEQRTSWLAALGEVAFVSDGALPFRDNVDHASRHGVRYIAEPGGSIRSAEVQDACREHQIALARTGLRLFHH